MNPTLSCAVCAADASCAQAVPGTPKASAEARTVESAPDMSRTRLMVRFSDGGSRRDKAPRNPRPTPCVRVPNRDSRLVRLSAMVRALLLVLTAIACGLGGLYLVRAALLEVGGFTLGSPSAPRQLRRLTTKRRFWAGGALILVVLLVSLDLYGSEELSKIVPLYSLSYVAIALIGQFFLGERVTLRRWIGILTIVAGVVVLLES